MDAAAVTSSLQSLHGGSATAIVDSRLSASHHSSSAASEEEDIVQATSALLQDLDQPSALSFSSYTVVHGQAAVTPQYEVRKDMSPFSPVFLKPSSNSSSPRLMTADGITMAGGRDCVPSLLSQHKSASPDGRRVLSDPLSHFIGCDPGATSVAEEIEAAFSGAFKDASQSPYFQSPGLSSDHLTKQMKSPSASYQSISSAPQQIPGIAIPATENHGLQGVPMNPSGAAVQPLAKAAEHLDRKPAAPPPPPKKPLSPYMRFSKGVWQKVKAEHPGMSVCEVGARIGRFWRELSESDKQHYVDEFNVDKARYDGEFQNYLRVTGLQASDLVKPRAKKKDTKDKQNASRSAKRQESQVVSSSVPPEHETANQESSAKPLRQANDVQTMMSNGQQDASFLVNSHPENGVKIEGNSSLPPFSQVWSNSEILTGQDLLVQMVLSGQHRQQQQQQQVQSDATRTSLDGSAQPLTKSYSHGMVASYEQQAAVQQPSASLSCATSNQATVVLSGHSDMGSKGWPWQQVSLQSSQSMEQSNEGVLVYQLPANGIWPQNNINMAASQSDQNGTHADAPMMSTMQVPYGGAQDGVNCVFQMASNAVCLTNDEAKRRIIVDQEKLQLRNALLEKSEEVLRLMKELEQVYSLIHQLKQQNDFFHQQWNLHHGDRSAAKSSMEVDSGGNSAHGT